MHMSTMQALACRHCGERVVGIVACDRGTTLTVVGVVAFDGVRVMMAYEGATSAEAVLCNEGLIPRRIED
jgi:hypothetical protein